MVDTEGAKLLAEAEPGEYLVLRDLEGLVGKYRMNNNIIIKTGVLLRRSFSLQADDHRAHWLTGHVDKREEFGDWSVEHLSVSGATSQEDLQPSEITPDRITVYPPNATFDADGSEEE